MHWFILLLWIAIVAVFYLTSGRTTRWQWRLLPQPDGLASLVLRTDVNDDSARAVR